MHRIENFNHSGQMHVAFSTFQRVAVVRNASLAVPFSSLVPGAQFSGVSDHSFCSHLLT
jgi:hypothetical protein